MTAATKVSSVHEDMPRPAQGDVPTPTPMSLLGLHERATHYPDLRLRRQESASSSSGVTSPFAPVTVRPGQDPAVAFKEHLLSVIDEALRIIDEDNQNDDDDDLQG